MNEDFERDMALFEEGKLDLAELERRHPGSSAIVEIHHELQALSSEPVPDPDLPWARLRSTLAPPKRHMRRAVLVAALAATLSGSAIAYAAGAGPVRSVVDNTVDWLTGSNDKPADSPSPSATPSPSPEPSESEETDEPTVSESDDPEDGAEDGTADGSADETSEVTENTPEPDNTERSHSPDSSGEDSIVDEPNTND